jgi:DNA modification methylase
MAVIEQRIEDDFAIYNGDCIEVMQSMPDKRVHFSIYSPPFGGLYHYSSNERDISNNDNYEEFFNHYGYVVKELARITLPGRCTAVHCTDVPSGNSGQDHLIDFPGDIVKLHESHGWKMIARHTIWKEPLWVRNRTMCKNLAHKTVVDDSIYAGVASADYLLVFRNNGANKIPVAHPTGLDDYAGEQPIPQDLLEYKGFKGNQIQNRYSHWIWRRYASSIWDDINMGRVLPFRDSKDPDDEKHVHPLQLDVIDRAIVLRTNPGETVLTPFMGVGSEVYSAVKLGRKGVGVELKPSYYKQALLNLTTEIDADSDDQPELFTEALQEVA